MAHHSRPTPSRGLPDLQNTAELSRAMDEAGRLLADDPARAAELAQAILIRWPGQPRASLILGCALRHAGDVTGAIAVLDPLARAYPTDAGIACELGFALLAADQAEAAIAPLEFATRRHRALVPAWLALARALRRVGRDHAAADAGAVAAASVNPQLVEAARCLNAGQPARAEALIRAWLAVLPDDPAATRLLGEVFWRLGRHDDAIDQLQRALVLAPGFEAARVFLTRVLIEADRLADALVEATRLTSAAPDEPGLVLLRASVLVKLGEQEAARELYLGLVTRGAASAAVWLNLGHVAKTMGRRDEAEAAFRQAIALSPQPGEAWWSIANIKTVTLGENDIAAMRTAISAGGEGEDAFHLHFALAKALEDRGEVEPAFAAYAEGNRLRRAAQPYDGAATHAAACAHARLFTARFFADLPSGGSPAPDPIFILGLPRAGSTLIEQILASHSAIEGTHELPAMMMIADSLRHRVRRGEAASFEAMLAALSPGERCALGERYLERAAVHRKTTKPHFIDKMPNNWQHVGLIRMILPNARIIDARRHPMACCFSAWKQHFARGQGFSYDLVDAGLYYRDYVAQMAAFDHALPGAVRRVIHEDLVTSTEAEVRALLADLDLPFEPACLAFWRNDRAVRTASAEQVRQPIYTDGLDHWRRFAHLLGPLENVLGPVLASWPTAPDEWRDRLDRNAASPVTPRP